WEKTKNPDDGTDFDRQQAAAKGVTDTRDTGDNVAGDYVINRELSQDDEPRVDYAEARNDYEIFDRIYSNGLSGYIPVEDAPRLVGFLNSASNDEEFKLATLKAIANNFEAGLDQIPFQMALAQARRNRNSNFSGQGQSESGFYKFDKLSLMEQLKIIEKISLKKIDKVYEGYWKNVDIEKQERERLSPTPNIKPKNPMRKKKPYDAEEHKENFIKSLIAKGKTEQEAIKQAWVLTQKGHFDPKNNESINENVPDNTKVRIINKLLADHFPASDLRKQMDAFFAIPDTQMLSDFRHAR
ncbi:uncharacterized protein METZ01_LOCUS380941, partial [marine metagenome]